MTKILSILTALFISSLICFGQPNSNFTVDRYNVCSGTALMLNNASDGADAFEWKIEGTHYSYSEDTVVTLVEPCYDLKEIRLIATNTLSGLSDSSAVVVEVFDTCFFHLTGDFLWCIGDTITMAVNPEEIATQFIITPPQTLISGCLTCPSLAFVLADSTVSIDRTSTYLGGCTEVTTFHSFGCNTIGVGNDEDPANDPVRVFPNPANEVVVVEAGRGIEQIRLHNAVGQVLLETTNSNASKV